MEDTTEHATAGGRRARNRRGEGEKLRAEILSAAVHILERDGRAEAVTLRAVAREVGIAAPSIYAHFDDRDAILAAVISDAFAELLAALTAPEIDGESDPVDRLFAGCRAYLEFAERKPQRYRVLFQSPRPPDLEANVPVDQMIGYDAFTVLVSRISACVAAGRSSSTEPFEDATALWVALHGYATLHAAVPSFPWLARNELLDRIVPSLAKIEI